MKINLDDLQPQESTIELSERKGEKFHLNKITLRTKIWIKQTFGGQAIEGILQDERMDELSQLVFYLLKDADKEKFGSYEKFLDCVVTRSDERNLYNAIFLACGVTNDVIKRIMAQMPAQPAVQKKKAKK